MIKKISDKVWQFYFDNFGSICYLVKDGKKLVMIDASSRINRQELISDLSKLSIKPEDISAILITHMHYDHIGNLAVFKNASYYASEKEISDFNRNPVDAILSKMPNGEIVKIKSRLKPITKFENKIIKVIDAPGHTRGSVAFYMPGEKILFSGDTLFEFGIGRTDLPTSKPAEMEKSLKKLGKMGYKILCAGH